MGRDHLWGPLPLLSTQVDRRGKGSFVETPPPSVYPGRQKAEEIICAMKWISPSPSVLEQHNQKLDSGKAWNKANVSLYIPGDGMSL